MWCDVIWIRTTATTRQTNLTPARSSIHINHPHHLSIVMCTYAGMVPAPLAHSRSGLLNNTTDHFGGVLEYATSRPGQCFACCWPLRVRSCDWRGCGGTQTTPPRHVPCQSRAGRLRDDRKGLIWMSLARLGVKTDRGLAAAPTGGKRNVEIELRKRKWTGGSNTRALRSSWNWDPPEQRSDYGVNLYRHGIDRLPETLLCGSVWLNSLEMLYLALARQEYCVVTIQCVLMEVSFHVDSQSINSSKTCTTTYVQQHLESCACINQSNRHWYCMWWKTSSDSGIRIHPESPGGALL